MASVNPRRGASGNSHVVRRAPLRRFDHVLVATRLLLVLVLAPALLPLGTAAADGFEVGAIFGAFRATIGGSNPKGSSFAPRTSGSVGVSIAYPLSRDVSLLFEPSYTVLGASVEVDSLSSPEKLGLMDVRLPYVAFPVGVRVSSLGGRAFVIGQLEPRWLQKAEAELLIEPKTTQEITDQVEPFDLAMNMGAGYALPWKPLHLSLELRYTQGLLNLDDGVSDEVEAPFPRRFRNTGFGLVLRAMLPVFAGVGEGDTP